MHHAQLFIGSFEDALKILPETWRTPSADVQHIVRDQFGIDDARSLSLEASRRPVTELGKRVFVISVSRATHEAQNALLKLLEDPAETSVFCLVAPHEDALIATVRSRLLRLTPTEAPEHREMKIAANFLSQSYKERLETIAARLKDKDEPWLLELLGGIEVWASREGHAETIIDLVRIRTYLPHRGSSKKMLLEHLALTVPVL